MSDVLDDGPFFHGSIRELRAGELLTASHPSNYRPEILMNLYFTALVNCAGRQPRSPPSSHRFASPCVLCVEPAGTFQNDPNVTDKKFPGKPTRSCRSRAPLRVPGVVTLQREVHRIVVNFSDPGAWHRRRLRQRGLPLRELLQAPGDAVSG